MRPAAMALVLTLLGATACSSGRSATNEESPMELVEASMNFDLADVEPFLSALAKRLEGGFSESEARRLAADISLLPVEGELAREYSVIFGGRSLPLNFEVFMDDVEAPDVYVYSPQPLAGMVEEEMNVFFE